MKTEEERNRERNALSIELRDERAEGQPYAEPWDKLDHDQRWERAQVWEGTDGEVHVNPHIGRSYVLRGRVIGPAHQRRFISAGDVLIVDVGPGGIGNRPRLHMVSLEDVLVIHDPGPRFERGLDEDYPV